MLRDKCKPITGKESALAAISALACAANDVTAADRVTNVYTDAAATFEVSLRVINYARAVASRVAYGLKPAFAVVYTVHAACTANRRQDLIAYIESTIISVYTTMKVEPGFRTERLITV